MAGSRTAAKVNDRATWIKGSAARCSVPPQDGRDRAWRVVLLGPPGVGKGTQAQLLCQRLGACHLSTGDIFRAAKSVCECEQSRAMADALGYMQRGELVPDRTVLDLLRERVPCLCCNGGFLLDGFPRTVAQADALQQLLESQLIALDAVIDYRLPIDEIVSRLSGRRTCANCKAVFHVASRPPKVENVCDACGGTLVQREDDRADAIRVRMGAYESSTVPLTDFYAKLDLLVPVTADGTPEQILERTLTALEGRA
jgi:adenylate kinase